MDREAPGTPEWEIAQEVTNLGRSPSEALAAGKHVSCCTVYASVSPGPGNSGVSIVRVDLEANVGNIRRHVASAFLLPGFEGPCITVTGMAATSFHAMTSGSVPRQKLRVAMSTRACCGGFAVHVPAELLDFPDPQTPDPTIERDLNLARPPYPWGSTFGQYWQFSTAQNTQNTPFVLGGLGSGLRLSHLHATAMGNNALVRLDNARGGSRIYSIPSTATSLDAYAHGAQQIVSLTWTGIRTLLIEGYR